MAKADGSVIIDTKMDTASVSKGTDEIKEELLDVGDSAGKANDTIGGDLAGGFKKLGKAIVAAGVIDALVDFGKEAIELGSDLEEVQNVVDVTFETMSDSVNKFAKDAQKSAGLSEKMAKQYVGTFGAMADSFGFTEQEAYEMSTALTQLTGDVASFYNLSQDEAATKLKGVFTGETEALKELGVVMTQTALDSYAMANGFGKTTSAMTEQEKVALRYQFVMDQLSAASGDFVRTQDSWANQSKILALQWESLMATLGSGMIDALAPGMGFLNDTVLPILQDVADEFAAAMDPKPSQELSKSLKQSEKAAKSAAEEFEETAESVKANAMLAEIYRDRLYELEDAGINTAEAQTAYESVVARLNELYPELNLKISEQTGLIDADSRARLQNVEAMKQQYIMMAVEEQLSGIYQAQAQAQLAVNQALANKEILSANIILKEQQLAEMSGRTAEEMIYLYNTMVNGATSLLDMDGNVVTLTADEQKLIYEILQLQFEQEKLDGKIAEGREQVSGYDADLQSITETTGIYANATNEAAEGQQKVSAAAATAKETIEELQKSYQDAKTAARDSIDAQIGKFAEMEVKSDLTSETIVENWKTQQAGFNQYKEDLKKATELGLDETLVKQLSDGSVESMAILRNLVSDTDLNVDEFNETFRKTQQARDEVSAVMAGIQTDVTERFAEMYYSIDGAWEDITYSTKLAIDQMARTINSLQGKRIYVDTYYRSFGKPGGTSGTSYSSTSVQSASVPYLAKGAVIPPNAPFMAVLGDQKRGTNIEAPLSTIQEAVAAVMGEQIGMTQAGMNAMLSELKLLREAVYGIEVGDSVIGEAAERYNQKMAISRGS